MCVPHGKFVGAYLEDGKAKAVAVPIRCNKWSCEDCGKKKRRQLYARVMSGQLAQAVDGFRPQYTHKLLTLTCPGKEYRERHTPQEALEDMSHKWSLTVRALKKRLGEFLFLRIVEQHKDGFPHFHVLLVGRTIVPKGILADFRRTWTDLHGMGNVDIQKNRLGSPMKAVRYLLKYLTKTPADLPKGKRVYTASRGALAPVLAPSHEYLLKSIFWRNFTPIESVQIYVSEDVHSLGQFDPDIQRALVEDFRENLYRGHGR